MNLIMFHSCINSSGSENFPYSQGLFSIFVLVAAGTCIFRCLNYSTTMVIRARGVFKRFMYIFYEPKRENNG